MERPTHSATTQSMHISELEDSLSLANKGTSLSQEIPHYREHTRRSTRRRNVSFYQQHIYTIDSVSYILKISLKDATELVKQKPEIIDMYHKGGLERYLKNGFKSHRSTPALKPSKTKISSIQEPVPKLHQAEESDSDYFSDDGSVSSESSIEEESDDFGNPQSSQEGTFQFRGHRYKNLDAVSRASGLPKSFFSTNVSTVKQPAAHRKRVTTEQRVGVAKKKKANNLHSETSFNGDLFTTGEDSQEGAQGTDVADNGSMEPFDGSEADKQIRLDDHSSSDAANSDDDVVITGQHPLFNVNNLHRDYSKLQSILTTSSSPRTDSSSINIPHRVNTADRPEIAFMLSSRAQKKSHSSRKVKRFKSSVTSSFKRPGSISRSRRAHSESNGRSMTRSKQSASRALRRISQPNNMPLSEYNAYANPILESSKKSTKNKKTKVLKDPFYYVSPGPENLLPRFAEASTLIYEGLSDKFIVPNNASRSIFYRDDPRDTEQDSALREDQYVTACKNLFKSSDIYRILYLNEREKMKSTVRVCLGHTSLSFSALLGDHVENFREFFRLLLDPKTIRFAEHSLLAKAVSEVLSFAAGLGVGDARSLVTIVDNFKVSLESNIRTNGHVKDTELYYLSICTLVYDLCSTIFGQNSIVGHDLRSKTYGVISLYFEFVCHIGGTILSQKIRDGGSFQESLEILSLNSCGLLTEILENSRIPDMQFVDSIHVLIPPKHGTWGAVSNIITTHLKQKNFALLKNDILSVQKFALEFGWPLNESVLFLVYESLKLNKFGNFPGEKSFPVIYSEYGINKDTSLNIYLNLLLKFSSQTGTLSSKFLEKIVPLSKNSAFDSTTFCNRVNILLCLSKVFKKNFENRLDEILLACDFQDRLMVQRMFMVIGTYVRVNQENKLASRVKALQQVIAKCIELKDYDSVTNFIDKINFNSLLRKTQRSMITVLSVFKNDRSLLKSCSQIIEDFVKSSSTREDLNLLKDCFKDLAPSLSPRLWCTISGKLVAHDQTNWSRLLKFNEFEDEPLVYCYILRHSGQVVYSIERESFIIALLKNLVSRTYSSSLNSFIRELEKVDPRLLSTKGALVQTHKTQITLSVITNLLNTEVPSFNTRIMTFLVKLMIVNIEKSTLECDIHYKNYATKITDVINSKGAEYLSDLNDLLKLNSLLGISQTEHQILSSKTSKKLDFGERLVILEQYVLDSIAKKQCLNTNEMKMRLSKAPEISKEYREDSLLCELCCLVSLNTEHLKQMPQIWILLSEITSCLSVVLQSIRNITQRDFFMISKVIKLFTFMVSFKDSGSEFLSHRLSTYVNIYRILSSMFDNFEGTNDYFMLHDISFIFMSRSVIFGEEIDCQDPVFLTRTPKAITTMLKGAKLFADDLGPVELFENKLLKEYDNFVKRFKINDHDYMAREDQQWEDTYL